MQHSLPLILPLNRTLAIAFILRNHKHGLVGVVKGRTSEGRTSVRPYRNGM
ncbi:hypothetical protein [Coleofasciculus sp.]|uniref:hypothetical protein n=1 Tax=Coleofasciculus sp. TaxID=3100458 RepID=UPI003A1EB6EB